MSYQVLDPLAQSFFIEEACVLTKVDLFFSAKDDFIPAFIQLRKNANGLPGSYIIPFSETFVYPADINISADGSVATTIKFDSPIYLEIGEYSLCLGSSSNNYRVYVSELGQNDDVTGNRITEQPNMGVLYKSQNASTWTPIQTEDLKFVLYRGKFATNTPIDIDFTIKPDKVGVDILASDPLEMYEGSTVMRVFHENHGMEDGSYVELANIFEAYSYANEFTPSIITLYGVNMNFVEQTPLVISNANRNSYTVTLPSAATGLPSSPFRFGGVAVSATRNFRYDALSVKDAFILDSNGTITRSFKGTSPAYSVATGFTQLVDGDNELNASGIITGDATNVGNLGGAESFTYRVTLESSNPYVSPSFDAKQLGIVGIQNLVNNPTYDSENNVAADTEAFITSESVTITQTSGEFGTITVPVAHQDKAKAFVKGTVLNLTGGVNVGKFRIVNVAEDGSSIDVANTAGTAVTTETATYTITHGLRFIAEEAATGSSTYSQYITRQVDFLNPSTSLNVRLDVNRPAGSDIEIYYKTKFVGEEADLKDKEFIRIPHNMPVSLSGEFIEIEKQLDDLTPFNGVIFKIVFKSTNSAVVPKCKNLRMIALA